jgi:hypothetical protein
MFALRISCVAHNRVAILLGATRLKSPQKEFFFIIFYAWQVEVKLRLADAAAHDKLVSLLAADQQHLYRQQNLFYDGSNRELSSQRNILRVRWFNDDEKVVITVKGKMSVVYGVGRAEEEEDEVPVPTALEFASNPSKILDLELPVIKSLKECAAWGPATLMCCDWTCGNAYGHAFAPNCHTCCVRILRWAVCMVHSLNIAWGLSCGRPYVTFAFAFPITGTWLVGIGGVLLCSVTVSDRLKTKMQADTSDQACGPRWIQERPQSDSLARRKVGD